jgi:hypothetical protein
MKRTLVRIAAIVMALGFLSFAQAEEKQVTLKGQLQCSKCSLSAAKECGNALIVKEAGKDITYFLAANDVSKKFDAKTCGGDKIPVSVVGTVAEKDGKKVITATQIKEEKQS